MKIEGILRKKLRKKANDYVFKEQTEIHYFELNLAQMTFGFKKKSNDEIMSKNYGYKQVLSNTQKLDSEDLVICEWNLGFNVNLYKNKTYTLFCENTGELLKWLEGFRLFFEKKKQKIMNKNEINIIENVVTRLDNSVVRKNEIELSYIKESEYGEKEENFNNYKNNKSLTNSEDNYIKVHIEENTNFQIESNYFFKNKKESDKKNSKLNFEDYRRIQKFEVINLDNFYIIHKPELFSFKRKLFLREKYKFIQNLVYFSKFFNETRNSNDDWGVKNFNNKSKDLKYNLESLKKEIKGKIISEIRQEEKKINNQVSDISKSPFKIKVVDNNDNTIIENLDFENYPNLTQNSPQIKNKTASKEDFLDNKENENLLEKQSYRKNLCDDNKETDEMLNIINVDTTSQTIIIKEKKIIQIKNNSSEKFSNFPTKLMNEPFNPDDSNNISSYDLMSSIKNRFKDNLHLIISNEVKEVKKINLQIDLNISGISTKTLHNNVSSPHFGNISIIAQRYNKIDNIDDWKDYLNTPSLKNSKNILL